MSEKSMGKTADDHHEPGAPAPDAKAAAECAQHAVRKHELALHPTAATGMVQQAGGAVRPQAQPDRLPAGQGLVEKEARSILPSVSSIVQAGAFGAALGGMTTGVMEMARVKQGEITTEEAVRNVVKSSAQGAATMAVASVAAQVVRSHPVFGFIALAAAGIGAFVILSGASKNAGAGHAAPANNTTDTTAPAVKPA